VGEDKKDLLVSLTNAPAGAIIETDKYVDPAKKADDKVIKLINKQAVIALKEKYLNANKFNLLNTVAQTTYTNPHKPLSNMDASSMLAKAYG
jgi:hypothetical protein